MPPLYDLAKCSVPTALVTGDIDALSTPADDAWLVDEAQSTWPASKIMVFNKQYHFTHGSFTMASDMSWVNRDIMPLIDK